MIRTAARRARGGYAAAFCRTLTTHHAVPTSAAAPHTPAAPGESVAPSPAQTTNTAATATEEENIMWRFPADDRVKVMMAQVEEGLSQSLTVTLNSAAPITHDLMEAALGHLYNKVESLRLCFRPRDGQLWVADMPHRKLDYQMLVGDELEEQNVLFRESTFDVLNGPLWKVRLLPCPKDEPCPMPEVKAALPYQCHLLLSVHHAANDGTVVMMVTQLLISILDKLLQGVAVSPSQVGQLRDGGEALREMASIEAALQRDHEKLAAAIRQHVAARRLPLLVEAFGVPSDTENITENLPTVILDQRLVDKFVRKCRAIGATTNAGFTALLNTSLVEVVRGAGLHRPVYHIASRHPVDCRRLMKDQPDFILGFHSLPMTQTTATPWNVRRHFWHYVQRLDAELRYKLKTNQMCKEKVLEALAGPEGNSHFPKDGARPPFYDHLFVNMYSTRAWYQGNVSNHVQVTEVSNFTTIHNLGYAMGQGLANFRGLGRLQLAFSTGAVSKQVAHTCLQKNLELLHDVTSQPD